MATNDLMMKIQLLVESGKSTAELDRLSKSLKQLTSELNSLETTKITPLTRDLQEIKQVAQTLRNVNISNFGKSLDNIKQSMIGLGVGTSNLDKLRESYQRLDTQLKSKNADNFRAQIEKSSLLAKTYSDGLVVLQGKLRQLSAEKSLDKALRVDTLSASLRVARAEAANLRNEINKLVQKKLDNKDVLSQDDSNQLQKYRSDLQRLNDTIVKDNVNLAKTNQEITKSYNEQIAQKNRQVVLSRNYLNIENNKLKTLNEQLKAETNKEKSIQRQITYYSKLTTSDALAKSLELQQQLAQSKTNQVDLKKQVADTESLTKAELARIQAMEKANTTAMKKANAEIKNQSGNLTTLGRLFGKSGGAVREFGDAIFFAFGPQMAGFIAAAGIANAVREVTVAFFEANKSVENLLRGLNAISGGQGVVLFNQLVDSANRLGIPLKQVSQSFLEVQAATTGTNFEGQKTKELFDALANALTVTGADAVQFNRGFRAMGQILSKDQLYAEELRQQLSEALPGAVQVFARALDVSPKQLLRFIEAGAIEGDNLRRTLALVTKELEKTYKVANEQDFTFTQKAALAQNALNLLFVELGNTGIWRAFGNALLFARDQFVALREAIPSLSDSFKNEFNLIAAIVSGGSEEINNSFQSIEPMFNFETLKKQLAEIASFINDSALGWLRSIVQFTEDAALIIKNFNAKLESQRQPLLTIGIEDEKLFAFLDKINQYTPSVKLKELFAAYLEDIKEISSTPVEIVPEIVPDDFNKFKKDVIEFNRNAEIDFTISDENLVKIYNEYIERINRANEAIREQNALNEQTNRILKQNTIESENAAKSRKTAEQVARENADAMEAFRKAQKDANALQKIYDIDLNYESTLKERSLKISKEQAKLDKEILGIQQTYQDTMLDINASKYQRWAEQGQITQEAARFLTESAKGDAARKAWVAAQDAVAAYNEEAAKGEKANKETLDALKQQADDQLRYAAGKAKEIGDEYRIKQIMEEQIALRNRQKQLIEDFGQILNRAEINTKANPVPEPEKKAVVNDLQSYLDQNKPIASIVPQIDEGSQQQAIESIRTVKDELDSLKQSSIIPVVLNLQDNTQGLIRSAGLTNIPDQNIRITVDDNGKLRQAMLDAKQLQEAIQNLQSGKKFTVEFLDPQGNVERIAEYVRNGKSVQINAKVDPNQAANEGAKAGQTITQAAQQAVDQKPIEIPIPDASQLRAITDQFSNFDLFSNLPSAKLNTGIQAAMDGAVATVKTGVAQMNQELVKGLTDKWIKLNIEPVTQSDAEGWKRNVQRLTATGPGLEFPIKGFQVPNGTWSDIVSAGNRYLETNRLLLSPAINPDEKIRLLNEIETIKPAIPATIDTDQALRDADRAAQQNPIEVSADAQPLIGDIQAQLEALRKSGATNIKVDFDEQSKKLLVTADITQAQGDIAALKKQIETSPAVQKVNFTFDPVPTTVDPAEQKVNRIFDEVPTQLAPAYQTVYRNIVTTGGSPSGMARGGLVPGGYSNRDSVSALLAPGEFVIPSSVVRALSPSFFYDLIRSRGLKIPQVNARENITIPHFAAGGLVQQSTQPIIINAAGKQIHLSGSREAANQLAKLLTQTGRAL